MEHPFGCNENESIPLTDAKSYGQGFVLDPDEAKSWIDADPRNAEVLFPYLNGDDLNSRPDASAPRWVIDFNDRTEEEAKKYRLPYERVLERVKPERHATNNRRYYVRLIAGGNMREASSVAEGYLGAG